MKSIFRAVTAEDAERVSLFLCRAFHASPDAPFLDRSLMAWKYFEPRGDWEGPRAYILERDGAIKAHAGIWPVTFSGGELRGIHMIDWASAADAPGAGLALVQKLAALFDFIYAIGGTEMTRKALPGFGFVEIGRQWIGACPLRPLRQITTHQYRNWKLGPRLFRNYFWSRQRKDVPESFEEISPDRIPAIPYDTRSSPRSPAFFEYLLRCPAARVRLYRIYDERGDKGHFALAVVRGQARIAGIWGDFDAAFSLARQAALRLNDAFELAGGGTEGCSETAAVHSGLHIVGHLPVYLLNKRGNFKPGQDFQFQLSDNDVCFLDEGRYSYWT